MADRDDQLAARPAEDYEKTYADFWQEIVENPDGTLNRDQVMRELHDFHALLDEVPKVYDEITGGRLSKPNTAAHHVIGEVEERTQEAIREVRQEIAEEIEAEDCGPGGDYERGLRVAARIARGEDQQPVLAQAGPDAYSDHHIVDLREDGWTVQHPLSCRPNLFDCPVNKAAERDLVDPPAEPGRFTCALADDGRFEIGDRIEETLAQPDDGTASR